MKTKINLHDRKNKLFIVLKPTKSGWERYESKDKKKWLKTHVNLTFKEAMQFKEKVINYNLENFFKLINRHYDILNKMRKK